MILIQTETVVCPLFSNKARAVELEPGEKIPQKAMTTIKHFTIEIPKDEYEKLVEEARNDGMTVQEKIFKKYRYVSELSKEWNVSQQVKP